jgi:hypothetical protein
MRQDVLERLAAANIQILPVSLGPRHIAFERDGFVALVERIEERLGSIGSAGMLTDNGFATLVFRNGRHSFIAKNFEQPATDSDVERLRIFQSDLEAALK